MEEEVYKYKNSLPNKLIQDDNSVTDITGKPVDLESSVQEYQNKPALPNKFLNPDGSYSTLNEIIASMVDTDVFTPVNSLPETGDEKKIYLVPSKNPKEGNKFDEYLYKDGEWELIGSMTLDLSNYWTTEQVKQYVDSQIKNVLGGEY